MIMDHMEREFFRRQRTAAHVTPVCPECLMTIGETHALTCPILCSGQIVTARDIEEDQLGAYPDELT